jgi:hypothetical protein
MCQEKNTPKREAICPSALSIRDIKNRCWATWEEAKENLEKKKEFREFNEILITIYEGDSEKRNNEDLLEIIRTNNFIIKDWVDDNVEGFGEDVMVRESLFRNLIKHNEISEDDVLYLHLPEEAQAQAGSGNIDRKMNVPLSLINPIADNLEDII